MRILHQIIQLFLAVFLGAALIGCAATANEPKPTHQFTVQVVEERLPEDKQNAVGLEQGMKATIPVVLRRLEAMEITVHKYTHVMPDKLELYVSGDEPREATGVAIGERAKLEFGLVDFSVAEWELEEGIVPEGSEVLPHASGEGLIAVKREGVLSGEHIVNAMAGQDPYTNEPSVHLQFDQTGTEAFAKLTKENVNKPLAIILDGKVLSVPNINEPITGGQVQITVGWSQQAANEMAIKIQAGALPSDLEIIEERELK